MKFAYRMERILPVDEEAGQFVARLAPGESFEVKLVKKRRSMEQNALFQVWTREIGEFVFEREISETEHDAIKIDLQRRCYVDTSWPFLVRTLPAPITGKPKIERTPTSKMGKWDMHEFMNWIQRFAAEQGLLLESQGEHSEMKAEAA